MKKFFIITLVSLSSICIARAQEYKINKASGKMVINLGSVTVEGYSGSEIIFKSARSEEEQDPRAKGLRAINGSGYTDNTGLGISVVDNGGTVEVNQIAASSTDIKIMVPKGVLISFQCHRVSNAGKVFFKNMENEIEISTDYNSIQLENVTGPATVRALYGSVDARFSDNIKGPISIASIYSTVDVAIPETTKANVSLSASHGEILAAAALKIEMEKKADNDMVSYSNSNVVGKLNGGGAELKLTAEYGKIYLRTTK
jgi:hypothetical protein